MLELISQSLEYLANKKRFYELLYKADISIKVGKFGLISKTIFRIYYRSILIYFRVVVSKASKDRIEKGSKVEVNLSSLFKLLLTEIKALETIELERPLKAQFLQEWPWL